MDDLCWRSISQLHHHIIRLWFCQDLCWHSIINLTVTSDHHQTINQTLVLSRTSGRQDPFGNCLCTLEYWLCLEIFTYWDKFTKPSPIHHLQNWSLFTVTIVVTILTLISSIIIIIDRVKDYIIHNYSALCALLVPTPLLVGRSTLDFLIRAFHASSPGGWW